jgi:hypothetical protein
VSGSIEAKIYYMVHLILIKRSLWKQFKTTDLVYSSRLLLNWYESAPTLKLKTGFSDFCCCFIWKPTMRPNDLLIYRASYRIVNAWCASWIHNLHSAPEDVSTQEWRLMTSSKASDRTPSLKLWVSPKPDEQCLPLKLNLTLKTFDLSKAPLRSANSPRIMDPSRIVRNLQI